MCYLEPIALSEMEKFTSNMSPNTFVMCRCLCMDHVRMITSNENMMGNKRLLLPEEKKSFEPKQSHHGP